MIYECPNCHTPQEAGHTSCPQCGAEFDGPVPEDALVPDVIPEAAASMEAHTPETLPEAILDRPPADAAPVADDLPETSSEPPAAPIQEPAQEAILEPALEAAAPEAPVLETVRPPAPSDELPYQRSTYQPPPYSSPPAYSPPPAPALSTQAYTAKRSQTGKLPKAVLIAAPLVLVLVVGGLIFSQTLDGSSDTAPPPMPVTAPAPPLRPAAAPVSSPIVMAGGTSAGAGDSRVKWLAGRWQAKNTDFYVFNEGGSGSQGSLTGKLPTQDFLWRIVQNQLMLYGAPKDQQIRFSIGPDDNTMYLRDSAGKPIQFTREVQKQ